jgi:hypothetical protein
MVTVLPSSAFSRPTTPAPPYRRHHLVQDVADVAGQDEVVESDGPTRKCVFSNQPIMPHYKVVAKDNLINFVKPADLDFLAAHR